MEAVSVSLLQSSDAESVVPPLQTCFSDFA